MTNSQARPEGTLFIDGEFRLPAGGGLLETHNPATGELLGRVAEGREEDVDAAVESARNALDQSWKSMRPADRGRILRRMADLIRERADRIAQLDCSDAGRLLRQARSGDVVRAAEMFEFYAGLADKIQGSTYRPDADSLAFSLREPFGVVGAIIPWNAPIVSAAGKVAPALACGNTVILKPAELAPLSSLELAAIATEADLPPGVLNVVPGYGQVAGTALVRHPGVDKISFTGGTATGQHILREAADTIKSVSLELGGKAPHIVFGDADLDAAMRAALFSPFNHAGQICTAGTRLFVDSSIAEEFIAELSQRAGALRIGDPSDPSTEIGPLISGEQVDRVTRYVETAIQEGARLRTGGLPPTEHPLAGGHYFAPTIFDEVDPSSRIAQEEIFGPVLSIFPFTDIDELIIDANQVPYGLSASLWTSDIHKATEFALRLDAGTVWINTAHKTDPSVPYSGFKASGLGLEYGMEAIDTYSQLKTVWMTTRPQLLGWGGS